MVIGPSYRLARIHFDCPDVSGVPPLIRAALSMRFTAVKRSAHARTAERHAPARPRYNRVRTKADIARIIINIRLRNEPVLPSRAHDTSVSFTFTGRTEISR